MKIPRSFTLLAGLGLLAFISPAHLKAQTNLINDNFESYTVPNAPVNPGDGNTNNWYFNANISATTALGSSPGGSGDNEQILRLQRSTTNSGYYVAGRKFETQDQGVGFLTLDLKFNINSFTDSAYSIQLINTTNALSSATIDQVPISMNITTTGNLNVIYKATAPGEGGSSTFFNPQGGALVAGDWYQLTIQANLETKSFKVIVTNLDNPTQSGSTPELYFLTDTSVFNAFLLRPTVTTGDAGHKLDWSLNDVNVTYLVPEPSVSALLLMGLLGVCLLRFLRR